VCVCVREGDRNDCRFHIAEKHTTHFQWSSVLASSGRGEQTA